MDKKTESNPGEYRNALELLVETPCLPVKGTFRVKACPSPRTVHAQHAVGRGHGEEDRDGVKREGPPGARRIAGGAQEAEQDPGAAAEGRPDAEHHVRFPAALGVPERHLRAQGRSTAEAPPAEVGTDDL